MNKLNFTLAKRQIATNKFLYLPYTIASSIMLFIFNLMVNLKNDDLILNSRGGAYIQSVLNFGQWIIVLFAALFLVYMTKSIVKSRYKELGLLYGLGMDKKALREILFIQNIILAISSILLGTFLSIILSPLFINLIGKILKIGNSKIQFNIYDVKLGFLVFGIIFILITIISLNSIRKTNPLKLSQMSKKGEKEPKASVLTFILAIIFIAIGYWKALSIEGIFDALPIFFPAVVCVIIGTFLFFRSVVITILKLLRKNKNIYYKKTNMTFIGELIKRSKESAMALSSITIISSMLLMSVVVMAAMFIGKNELLYRIAPKDYIINYSDDKKLEDIEKEIENATKQTGFEIKDEGNIKTLVIPTKEKDYGNLSLSYDKNSLEKDIRLLTVVDEKSFNKINKTKLSLDDGEVVIYDSNKKTYDNLSLEGINLKVKENIEKTDYIFMNPSLILYHNLLLVVKDTDKIYDDLTIKKPEFDVEIKANIKYFNTDEKNIDKNEEFSNLLNDYLSKNNNLKENIEFKNSIITRLEFDDMHKGAYITVILLAFMFLVSTIVVVYYKQAAEGLDDGRNINVLKKIGMSNKEIRKSVSKQNNFTFFGPLVLAIIHILVASKLSYGMLKIFSMLDLRIFIKVEIGCILVFSLIYLLIFKITLPIYFEMGKLNKE